MPTCYLILGCISESIKYRKNAFFVPRKEELKKSKKMLLIKQTTFLKVEAKCNKHFLKENILWKRFLTDSNEVSCKVIFVNKMFC